MGLLKSTVVSVGLLTGLAATGHAQSVSMLPPEAGTTAQSCAVAHIRIDAEFLPQAGRQPSDKAGKLPAAGAVESG
jgi:hypothetical protein